MGGCLVVWSERERLGRGMPREATLAELDTPLLSGSTTGDSFAQAEGKIMSTAEQQAKRLGRFLGKRTPRLYDAAIEAMRVRRQSGLPLIGFVASSCFLGIAGRAIEDDVTLMNPWFKGESERRWQSGRRARAGTTSPVPGGESLTRLKVAGGCVTVGSDWTYGIAPQRDRLQRSSLWMIDGSIQNQVRQSNSMTSH